jgi:hypothetical protein
MRRSEFSFFNGYYEKNKLLYQYLLLRAKNVGHQISVSFEKFDVVQALLSFFLTLNIPVDSLKIYFILLFSFSKCLLLLIKVDFDWNFALNKYSLQPTILNDNVNQFKVGLKSGKGPLFLSAIVHTLFNIKFLNATLTTQNCE